MCGIPLMLLLAGLFFSSNPVKDTLAKGMLRWSSDL